MNKKYLNLVVIIGLLLSNLLLVLFIVLKPTNPHKIPREPKFHIIEKLELTSDQILKLDSLIEKHKTSIHEIDVKLNKQKKMLYNNLKEKKGADEEIIMNINKLIEELELIHYNHFLEIRELCHENQLDKFNDLTDDIVRLFSVSKPPPPRKRPRP